MQKKIKLIFEKVQKALIEMSRFYWRKGSFSKVYELWISHLSNSFFALHEIEMTTFLGLSAFCIWKAETDKMKNNLEDLEEENEEGEEDENRNEIESSSEEETMGQEEEESSSNEEEEEMGDEISQIKIKPNFQKKSYKANLDRLRNEKIFRIHRFAPTVIKVALSKEKRRSQNLILAIELNKNNQNDPTLYAAREYLSLALRFNPSCETSLMHLLYVNTSLIVLTIFLTYLVIDRNQGIGGSKKSRNCIL